MRLRLSRSAAPRPGDRLGIKTWGVAALVWTGVVLLALAAGRALPQRQAQLMQLAGDGATWGAAANAIGMLTAILWQRERPWGEAGAERAVLAWAFGNVVIAALAGVNAWLPAPLLPWALPPILALSLAAGAAAAAVQATYLWTIERHQHG